MLWLKLKIGRPDGGETFWYSHEAISGSSFLVAEPEHYDSSARLGTDLLYSHSSQQVMDLGTPRFVVSFRGDTGL